jgi:hypothetical protein
MKGNILAEQDPLFEMAVSAFSRKAEAVESPL